MKFSFARVKLPALTNALLAVLSAILLTLAFPNFDLWFLAWFALVPLFYAIEREKESAVKSFVLGWIFGTLFFAGSCWWLTFSFITYGGIPTALAYFLLFLICSIVGFFPAVFGAVFSIILKRFGTYGILSAPFLWTAVEFLRFNLTGNNWNAIGYSQAFAPIDLIQSANVGGVYLVGFNILVWSTLIFSMIWAYFNQRTRATLKKLSIGLSLIAYIFPVSAILYLLIDKKLRSLTYKKNLWRKVRLRILAPVFSFLVLSVFIYFSGFNDQRYDNRFIKDNAVAYVIALQVNVPMSGLNEEKWNMLRQRHVELAEDAFDANISKFINKQIETSSKPEEVSADGDFYNKFYREQFQKKPKIIIFPESPMNFMYERDEEFQSFIGDFARKHNAYVLFNSAEPNPKNKNFYNSAIMINPQGEKIGQYDKIHLVPFGEFAPVPSAVEQFVPTLVGNFQYGENYNLFPFGEAKGGIMICYESHFPSLSREFAKRGADVLIEMTNDGYLGNTGVLRQHLASAVFRAVETNRPVLRATNVGVTAYINERGAVLDAADVYTEATRVWTVAKSDGELTFYVRYGEWFAWLCSIVSGVLLAAAFRRKTVFVKQKA